MAMIYQRRCLTIFQLFLELCAVIEPEKAREVYDYCKPKLEYIRDRLIEAKLTYAFLFDIILSVANGLEDGAR